MNKHTPGPWWSHMNKINDVSIIKRFPDGQESHEIARCKSGFENACLIAAAPDLLAALQSMLEAWGYGGTLPYPIAEARAAIAKATGGQP